jgi:hypothetical protein
VSGARAGRRATTSFTEAKIEGTAWINAAITADLSPQASFFRTARAGPNNEMSMPRLRRRRLYSTSPNRRTH